jgi:L-asparagine transporter-like permease
MSVKMRKENIGGTDVFKVPLYPYLPLLSLLFIMGLIIIRGVFEFKQSMIDLTFIVTGIPFAIYWCYFKAKSTGLGGDKPG